FASDAESLGKEAAAGLAECRQRLEEILGRGRPRTIENLLVPYDRLLSGLSELQGQSRFLFDVHPNAAVRETADKWYQEAERFALMATRHELARVLGHESFADYVVQDKMIGSAKGIVDFLAKVRAASEERAKEDSEILIARKRKDVPNATSLQAWDTNFYSELVRAENFDFDAKLLRPYFAFGKVLEGLFEITRELFGVRYERVSGVPVWHPSVDVYDVVDGDRRIGRFYLDLHPRKDKY